MPQEEPATARRSRSRDCRQTTNARIAQAAKLDPHPIARRCPPKAPWIAGGLKRFPAVRDTMPCHRRPALHLHRASSGLPRSSTNSHDRSDPLPRPDTAPLLASCGGSLAPEQLLRIHARNRCADAQPKATSYLGRWASARLSAGVLRKLRRAGAGGSPPRSDEPQREQG